MTPIMAAAVNGDLDTVEFLIDSTAQLHNKDLKDQSIIHLAAQHDQHDVIELILDHQRTERDFMVNENDQYDNTPLHVACQNGFLETVKVLVDHGADCDNKNEDERTPFHMAAASGHTEVVKYLLGVDKTAVNDKDEDDNTALHLAATNKMTNTLQILLENGSSVHERNDNFWTPLDCAAAAGAYKCVQKLLEHGSKIDPRDRKNTTPLHLSAMYGHNNITQLLLDNGADIQIENDNGRNALEIAVEFGNKEVAETILSSEHWRTALKTAIPTRDGKLDTPMRILIRKFPELAKKVLDRCIKKSDKKEETYLFDYTFLEDAYHFRWSEGSYVYEEKLQEDPYAKPITVENNHPLVLMVKQKQKHLLKHPLCLALLRQKWKSSGLFVFILQVLLYLGYLVSITTYILIRSEDSFNLNQNKSKIGIARYTLLVFIGLGLLKEVWDLNLVNFSKQRIIPHIS